MMEREKRSKAIRLREGRRRGKNTVREAHLLGREAMYVLSLARSRFQ